MKRVSNMLKTNKLQLFSDTKTLKQLLKDNQTKCLATLEIDLSAKDKAARKDTAQTLKMVKQLIDHATIKNMKVVVSDYQPGSYIKVEIFEHLDAPASKRTSVIQLIIKILTKVAMALIW